MGVNRYKKSFKCDCGCDYGSCDKTNIFIMESFRSCDIYKIYYKHHSEHPNSKMEHILTLSDDGYSALLCLLNTNKNEEKLTKQDIDELNP